MTEPTTIAPVRREVTVGVSPARAFQLFTEHFDAWWPRGHHIGTAELRRVIIEPHVGGRWCEVGVDGSQCDWGRVLAWEEPYRLVLSWHLNGQFSYDPDPARASEVEVTFRPAPGSGTAVTLEHRYFERAFEGDQLRRGVSEDGGWRGLLGRYAALAAVAATD